MGNAQSEKITPTPLPLGENFEKIPLTVQILFECFEINGYYHQIPGSNFYLNSDSENTARQFFTIDDLMFVFYEYLTFPVGESLINHKKLLNLCLHLNHHNFLENALCINKKKTEEQYSHLIFSALCIPYQMSYKPHLPQSPFKDYEQQIKSELQFKIILKHLSPPLQKILIALQLMNFNKCWFHHLPEYIEGQETILSKNKYPEQSPFDLIDQGKRHSTISPTIDIVPLFYDLFIFMRRYRTYHNSDYALKRCQEFFDLVYTLPHYYAILRKRYHDNPYMMHLIKLSIEEANRVHCYDHNYYSSISNTWYNLVRSI